MFQTRTAVIFDLEWTAWPDSMRTGWADPARPPEIIQIGAVRVAMDDGCAECDSFSAFVRPKINPKLSDYIMDLTNIRQTDIDSAGVDFPSALAAFTAFIGSGGDDVGCYGGDGQYIAHNCALNALTVPPVLAAPIDVRAGFVERGLVEPQ